MAKEKEKNNEYPFSELFASNTLDVKIEGVKQLLEEKISTLKERVNKLENGEIKRDDRKFQWLTLSFGAIFGAALTIIVQSILKIINK